MVKIDRYYWVNLDRSIHRRAMMEEQFKKFRHLNGNAVRVSAVDGSTLNVNTKVFNYEGIDYELSYYGLGSLLKQKQDFPGYELTYGALGFWLTHLNIFRTSVKTNQTYLVLDDDLIICSKFDDTVDGVLRELPDDFDFCYLSTLTPRSLRWWEGVNYSKHLEIPKGGIFGPNGYIVSPKGAKKLLDNLKVIDRQLDSALWQLQGTINFYKSKDNIVNTNSDLKSEIQK